MRAYYLDISVAIRIMLGHSNSAAKWFDETIADRNSRIVSSRLLRTEIIRVLRKQGLGTLDHPPGIRPAQRAGGSDRGHP
ncbi:hypothetical protein ACFVVM_15990 [Nocardia sp. NPDC058176]|uniref:hypothetical protein n=1 Tax=Nocardia sp. NPDC058176 TaxID=3346368 RepID=UPI0036DAD688